MRSGSGLVLGGGHGLAVAEADTANAAQTMSTRTMLEAPNILILGCGRSGTSMVAGTLASGPWYLGDNYIRPRVSNPKGFFEDSLVNKLNERIIGRAWHYRLQLSDLRRNQLWLARVPRWMPLEATPKVRHDISALCERQPFCFKDPRFAYTLPVWQRIAPAMKFIVVFRHPAETTTSIVRECQTANYLRNVRMTRRRAVAVWRAQYEAILRHADCGGDWLYLHFQQLFDQDALQRLQDFAGGPIDVSFPDSSLNRSKQVKLIDEQASAVFQELCRRAGFVSQLPS
jgi:hypothetical protein